MKSNKTDTQWTFHSDGVEKCSEKLTRTKKNSW